MSAINAIEFTADGRDYKLEVTLRTLKVMEDSGVNFAELGNKLLAAETLWKGLFIAHHNSVPDSKRMEYYRALKAVADGQEPQYDDDGEPVDALMVAIGALYESALNKLKRGQGNLEWKVT